MNHSKFQRGSGMFSCECCGRNTRNVGQSVDSKDCVDCWELAGYQNMVWDGDFDAENIRVVRAHLKSIESKKGNVAKVRSELADLFAAIDKLESPESTPEPVATKATKYDYPAGLTSARRKVFRAKARKAAKS